MTPFVGADGVAIGLTTEAVGAIQIAHRIFPDRGVGDAGDVARGDANIDNAVIAFMEIVDGRAASVNPFHLIMIHPVMAGVRIAKIPRGHKCEEIHAQAEIEAGPDGGTAIVEATVTEGGERRQRCPAACRRCGR